MFWCFSLVLEAYISNRFPLSLHSRSNSNKPKKTCSDGEKILYLRKSREKKFLLKIKWPTPKKSFEPQGEQCSLRLRNIVT